MNAAIEKRSDPGRVIVHVDMDAFYASVEIRDRPELVGLPVVVGGDASGRGVVAAASYAARRFGIHSAMPSAHARRLCPDAVFLKPRMDIYALESERIRKVLDRFTPLIEPLSLDEAYLDVTGSMRLFGGALPIAEAIKSEIREETALVASVGIGPCKLVAKLASDHRKPDGLVHVKADEVQTFLDPLPVGRIWGVGSVAVARLAERGIETVADLRVREEAWLEECFGRWGKGLWRLAQGLDDREVVPESRARSISHERTFERDIVDRGVLGQIALDLLENTARRLRRSGLRARTVQLKVRFSDFQTITRAYSLPDATDSTDALWAVTTGLLEGNLSDPCRAVRLLGVGVSGLGTGSDDQLDLFASADPAPAKLDGISDAVTERFGRGSMRRARTIQRKPLTGS